MPPRTLSTTFDRYDIATAYYVLEMDWHDGGWLRERPSNRRRMESCSVQLARLGFRPDASARARLRRSQPQRPRHLPERHPQARPAQERSKLLSGHDAFWSSWFFQAPWLMGIEPSHVGFRANAEELLEMGLGDGFVPRYLGSDAPEQDDPQPKEVPCP